MKMAPLCPFESPDVLDTYQGGYGSHLSPPPSPMQPILVWLTFGGGVGGLVSHGLSPVAFLGKVGSTYTVTMKLGTPPTQCANRM